MKWKPFFIVFEVLSFGKKNKNLMKIADTSFKQYDVIVTKEQSLLQSASEGENIQTQYNVLGYSIEFYFQDYRLSIKIHENGQSDRNIDWEIKRQKAIEQELGFEFIRMDHDKEDFDIFEAISEIFRCIKQSFNG